MSILQAPVDFGVAKRNVLAAGSVVGRVETAADIAFIRPLARIPPVGVMEA